MSYVTPLLRESEISVRLLELNDYHKGFMNLINSFTRNPEKITYDQFQKYYQSLDHNINQTVVIELDNQIVATGKLLIDHKFHNNFSPVGHIEDIVTDPKFRLHGLATKIVKDLIIRARVTKAYKVVLECHSDLIPFYQKMGLQPKGIEMCYYLK